MENNQERNMGERILMPMCSRVINSDVSEDFTLPDYYPEIRRVLYVNESPLPPSAFVGGNKIDVSGVIDYTLVYISADGNLCSAPLSAEHSCSVGLENAGYYEMGEGVTLMMHTACDNSVVRVIGPRKLNVRSHLRTCINALGRVVCDMEITEAEALSSIERLMGSTQCAEIICESSDLITLSERYAFRSDDRRIALARGNVNIDQTRIDGNIAEIVGEVVVNMTLVSSEESENATIKLPFEAAVELEGGEPMDGGTVRASGTVTNLSLNVEEDGADIEADVTLKVCYGGNRLIEYVLDAYSTQNDSRAITRTYNIPTIARNANINTTLGGRIALEEAGIPTEARIVDICPSVTFDGVESGDEGCFVKGKCRYHVIYMFEGDYLHAEVTLPYTLETGVDGEPIGWDLAIDVNDCRCRIDGNELVIDSALLAAYTVLSGHEIEMLSGLELLDAEKKDSNCWTVVYVSPGDTSWSIAKRYGVSKGEMQGDPATDKFVIIER